jgi:hypothetical protein
MGIFGGGGSGDVAGTLGQAFMAAGAGGSNAPPPPPPVPPAANPPTFASGAVNTTAAAALAKSKAAAGSGMSNTDLTGPQGVTDGTNVAGKKLTGQ